MSQQPLLPLNGTANVRYEMTMPWFLEVRDMAYNVDLEHYQHPYEWRRAYVEALYHRLRALGNSHETAYQDALSSLPHLELDDEGTAYLDI